MTYRQVQPSSPSRRSVALGIAIAAVVGVMVVLAWDIASGSDDLVESVYNEWAFHYDIDSAVADAEWIGRVRLIDESVAHGELSDNGKIWARRDYLVRRFEVVEVWKSPAGGPAPSGTLVMYATVASTLTRDGAFPDSAFDNQLVPLEVGEEVVVLARRYTGELGVSDPPPEVWDMPFEPALARVSPDGRIDWLVTDNYRSVVAENGIELAPGSETPLESISLTEFVERIR